MMKDIPGFPGYKINENGIIINKNGHMMQPSNNNDTGRLRVCLETYDENGKLIHRHNKSISRLVAETFIDNPDNLPLVMHLDNDPLHNHVSNLKWGTQSDNVHQIHDERKMFYPSQFEEFEFELVKDGEEPVKCLGREGIARLLNIDPLHIVPDKVINFGPYRGYKIIKTERIVDIPLVFINKKDSFI